MPRPGLARQAPDREGERAAENRAQGVGDEVVDVGGAAHTAEILATSMKSETPNPSSSAPTRRTPAAASSTPNGTKTPTFSTASTSEPRPANDRGSRLTRTPMPGPGRRVMNRVAASQTAPTIATT